MTKRRKCRGCNFALVYFYPPLLYHRLHIILFTLSFFVYPFLRTFFFRIIKCRRYRVGNCALVHYFHRLLYHRLIIMLYNISFFIIPISRNIFFFELSNVDGIVQAIAFLFIFALNFACIPQLSLYILFLFVVCVSVSLAALFLYHKMEKGQCKEFRSCLFMSLIVVSSNHHDFIRYFFFQYAPLAVANFFHIINVTWDRIGGLVLLFIFPNILIASYHDDCKLYILFWYTVLFAQFV